MEKIESVNNRIVKYTCALNSKKARKEEGKFIAEGARLVLDAMKTVKPEYIIVSESFYNKDFDVKTYVVSDRIFKKLSDTVNPQGLLGVFKISEKNIEDISGDNVIVLNNVSDPGNVGTILRTANAAGFYNVIMDSKCVDLYNPKTVRSSMSALFNQNIYISDNLERELKLLKEKGFSVLGSALSEESKELYRCDIKGPVAVVVGNEANGADEEILKMCDQKIIIPMKESIESLNVSIAASVIMYEILRRQEYEN